MIHDEQEFEIPFSDNMVEEWEDLKNWEEYDWEEYVNQEREQEESSQLESLGLLGDWEASRLDLL